MNPAAAPMRSGAAPGTRAARTQQAQNVGPAWSRRRPVMSGPGTGDVPVLSARDHGVPGRRWQRTRSAWCCTAGLPQLLLVAALLGIPLSVVAFGFLVAVHELEHVVWHTLPAELGFDHVPAWWAILALGPGRRPRRPHRAAPARSRRTRPRRRARRRPDPTQPRAGHRARRRDEPGPRRGGRSRGAADRAGRRARAPRGQRTKAGDSVQARARSRRPGRPRPSPPSSATP